MKRLSIPLFLTLTFVLSGCFVVVEEKDDGGGRHSEYDADKNHHEGGGGGGGGGHVSVYDEFGHLPKMGETKKYFRVHGNEGQVDRGFYEGDWNCGARGLMKQGAGVGETVIHGDLEIKGNNWVLKGCTITGDAKIRGNNNDISGCEIRGDVDIRGNKNKTP